MSARRMRTAGVLVVAMALAVPGPTVAQEAPPPATDTLVLTLEDAVRIAEAHNPVYRQAVNRLGLTGVETRATWANQVLPRASLDLFNTNFTGNVQRIARDNFGNPIENPQADWVYFSGTTQALNLSWSVQGASLFHALNEQDRANLDREITADVALAGIRADVRARFYEVLEQRSLLDVEEEIALSRQIDLELAERLFRLAESSRVDLLQARLEIEQQALNVREQRNAYEQARLAVRTVLGDAELPPFRLADEPVPVFDPGALDADALIARALETNPDVVQAASGVEGGRIGVKQARNQWWPNLSVGYNVYRRSQTREADALFDVSFDEDLDQSFFVSLSVPFFSDYFGNRRNIEQAEVELDNQREQLRQTRLRTEERVRNELLRLETRYESLRLTRRSLEIAEEALELAREEYRMGTRTFEQLRQSVESEADARRQVITSRYGFVDALLALEEAVGAPVGAPTQ